MIRYALISLMLLLAACQSEQQTSPLGAPKKMERPDQPQEANDFFVFKRAPRGEYTLDYALYQRARKMANQLPLYSSPRGRFVAPGDSSSLNEVTFDGWTFLGPGNIGGRTRQLVIDPDNTNTLYAAAVAGGVWKSTNGGASWQPLNDLMGNLAVTSLVMDPNNSNVLYAGTGEGFFNVDAVRGAGIFKTTDAGASWTQLASTTGSDFHYVNDLKISAWDSNRIYAATNSGVFRSTDGGASWTAMNLNDGTNYRNGRCTQLQLRTDLNNQDVLFASCSSSDGNRNDDMIWRSANAQAATPAWSAVLNPAGMARSSMALAPSNQAILYVLASHDGSSEPDYRHGLQAVYRTTDGGDTWATQVDNGNNSNLINGHSLNTVQLTNPASLLCWGNGFSNQGWYDNVIAVDPIDPDRVWTGGIDLMVSDDGGQNWAIASYWWLDPRQGGINSDSPHADQHVIVFDPNYDGDTNKKMYVANDGGIYRADDATASGTAAASEVCPSTYGDVQWIENIGWQNLNNSYGVTQFYNGQAYPDGATYFGGAQDNGTLRGNDTDGPDQWEEIRGGDGGYVSIDPNDTQILYSSYTRLSLKKSTDGGSSWAVATNGIDTSLDHGFLFITPHTMDPGNANNLWIGGNYLWRTTDAAANWVQASVDNGARLSAVAVSPVNSDAVLAGFEDGQIRYQTAALSADATTNWPSVTPDANCYISSVRFAPGSDQVAYATSSTFGCNHVFKTVNGGASWSNITNNLPDIPAHDLVVDPNNSSHLLLATDLGMFVSIDGGASWAQENTDFANVVVESLDMEIISGKPVLYAFTHGRGAWKAPVTLIRFTDVPQTHWAFSYIETLAANGITNGCTPTEYCPGDAVDRAQMAVFLLRAEHGKDYVPPNATGTVFDDVPGTYWAAAWIEQLAAEGITNGCDASNYCPNASVSRAQMAVFLLRAKYGQTYVPPTATGTVFDDVPATHWAAAWIEQLAAEGVTNGCDANNYCPDASVNRDQMAVFIVRTFGL